MLMSDGGPGAARQESAMPHKAEIKVTSRVAGDTTQSVRVLGRVATGP